MNLLGPVTNFDGPVTNFDGPVTIFDGPVTNFDGPVTIFDGPATNLCGLAILVGFPTLVATNAFFTALRLLINDFFCIAILISPVFSFVLRFPMEQA
jgi:hypothetical protein